MITSSLAEEYYQKGFYLHYKQCDYEKANIYYLKAMGQKWDYIEPIYAMAQNLRLNLRVYKEAIFYYTRVIDIDPLFEHALFQRGLCKEQLKDYEGRIEDLTELLQYKPNPDYYISRAIIKKKIGQHSGVIDDCNKAISLNVSDPFAIRLKGEAKLVLKDFEGAINEFDEVIKIEDYCPDIYSSHYISTMKAMLRGYSKAILGLQNYQDALVKFENYVNKSPSHLKARRILEETKSKLGL